MARNCKSWVWRLAFGFRLFGHNHTGDFPTAVGLAFHEIDRGVTSAVHPKNFDFLVRSAHLISSRIAKAILFVAVNLRIASLHHVHEDVWRGKDMLHIGCGFSVGRYAIISRNGLKLLSNYGFKSLVGRRTVFCQSRMGENGECKQ